MAKSIKFAITLILLAAISWTEPAISVEPTTSQASATQQLVSSHCAYLKPRRIVIITTANRQDRLKEQDHFAQSLASHLRTSNQYDVVISRQKVCLEKLPMRCGKFDERDVLAMSHQYNADTVLYCDVQQISAYEPMRLQTSILLVSAHEAISLVSTTSAFDLKHTQTRNRYASFTQQHCDGDSEIHLNSPTQFIEFAASEFANGLNAIWSP